MLADFMTWCRNTYPQLRKAIFHIENEGHEGGQRGAFLGAQALAKGKLKGVFDVLCVYKGKMTWIEFKLPKGVLSPAQKELKEIWEGWGMEIHVIRNFEEFNLIIQKILRC